MTVFLAWLTVAALTFLGLTLNRSLAVWAARRGGAAAPAEIDLLLTGALPGLTIVGVLATVLGVVHLLRVDVFSVIGVLLLLWRRHDAKAILMAAATVLRQGWGQVRLGNPLPLLALGAFLGLLVIFNTLVQIPASSVDVWAFHIPLAKSIVAHAGFVHPQIDHAFYGNIPLFFNMLFATAMMYVNHDIAASLMSVVIYISFLLCLLSSASIWRSLGFLLICFLIVGQPFFSPGAAVPLTDNARSCFSIAAFIFLCRYIWRRHPVDLMSAALVTGGAVSGKYTELVTAGLIGLCLLPLLLRRTMAWKELLLPSAAFLLVAGYWYGKNLLLLGNPIYPFLFGHPGLTDQWMAEYMLELTQAFDPANRHFVTDLTKLQGWRDFLFILHGWFFSNRAYAKVALVLIAIGFVLRPGRMAVPILLTVAMFVFWYARMFNHIRWATPAYLMYFSTAFFGWMFLSERLAGWWRTGSAALPWHRWPVARLQPSVVFGLSLWVAMGVAALPTAYRVLRNGPNVLAPSWIDADLFSSISGQQDIEIYLDKQRSGYRIYRYIAKHNLRKVFQPYDNGGTLYIAAYNGGDDGGWLLPHYQVPESADKIDGFIRKNNIRYFITASNLHPVMTERLGEKRLEMAAAVIEKMRPSSTLLVSDAQGWQLYRYDGKAGP